MIINNPGNITPKKNSINLRKKSLPAEESSTTENESNSFLSILESIAPSGQESTRGLNELWRKLPEIEKRFLNTPSQQNMNEYKSLVKEITNHILQTNVQIVQARRRGRHDKKMLLTVKVIDENLQILATTMLSPYNSAFALLKQIEKIRGLLMDLQE